MNSSNETLHHLLELVQPPADAQVLNITSSRDAENLPHPDSSFDLVTCDVAHHFPDNYRLAIEARRVLKPDGILAVYDFLVPDHKRAAEYLNAFACLRDPSHLRAYSESDWRSTFLDADLTIEQVETTHHNVKLLEWAAGCSAYVVERLQILLAQAPRPAADWLRPTCVGTADATFNQVTISIIGKKTNG